MEHVNDFGRAIYFSGPKMRPPLEPPLPPDDTTEPSTRPRACRLAKQLRESLNPNEFLPLDNLVSLVSVGNVYQELLSTASSGVLPITNDGLRSLATRICEWKELPATTTSISTSAEGTDRNSVNISGNAGTTTRFSTRRAIFAVLVLIEQAPSIREFVCANLWDCHLPFRMKEREPDMEGDAFYVMYDNEGRQIPDTCFHGWRIHDWESFRDKQWQTLAPYFAFEMRKQDKPLHYNLDHPGVILPFISDKTAKHPQQGGFSEVSLIQVHNAHYSQSVSKVSLRKYLCVFPEKVQTIC